MILDLKLWQWCLIAMGFLGLFVSAGYVSRDYTAKKQLREMQVSLETETEKELTVSESLSETLRAKSEMEAELTSLRSAKKTWERGTKSTDAKGIVTETWDRGTSDDEESIQQTVHELEEMSAELQATKEQASLSAARADRLEIEKLSLDQEVRHVAFHGAVLAGWDLSGGLPEERAQIQALGSLGPVIMGASLAPAGPWAKPGNSDNAQAIAASLRPVVWMGMKL